VDGTLSDERRAVTPSNQTFKNPRWQTAVILKIVKYDISATVSSFDKNLVPRYILAIPT